MRVSIGNIAFYSHTVIHLNEQIFGFTNGYVCDFSAYYLIPKLICIEPFIIMFALFLIPRILIHRCYYQIIIKKNSSQSQSMQYEIIAETEIQHFTYAVKPFKSFSDPKINKIIYRFIHDNPFLMSGFT